MTRERTGSVRSTGSDAPEDFKCPLSLDLMRDPVMTPTGRHTFERAMIEAAIDLSGKHPLTREPLRKEDLRSNRELKERIDAYCREKAIVLPPLEIVAPQAINRSCPDFQIGVVWCIWTIGCVGMVSCLVVLYFSVRHMDALNAEIQDHSFSNQPELYHQLIRDKEKAVIAFRVNIVFLALSGAALVGAYIKMLCCGPQNDEPPRGPEFLPPPEAHAVAMPDEHAALLGRMLR